MLVDSHCHLDFPELSSQLDDVLLRAKEAEVDVLQTICTRVTKFETVYALAEAHDPIFCSVGLHPLNVDEEPEVSLEELCTLSARPKVIGIGETGLDYYYEHSARATQQRSFITHIQAAQDTGLPIIVHTRDADDDTMDLLEDAYKKKPFLGLIHCFTASKRLAERAMDIGFKISVSGIITFKNAKELQETISSIDLEHLLVETDAPYLAPVPHRGKTNEPAFTRHTAEFLAQLKGVSYDDVAKQTTDNFYRLFTKATR